jgi:hypothetical protein
MILGGGVGLLGIEFTLLDVHPRAAGPIGDEHKSCNEDQVMVCQESKLRHTSCAWTV